jgi:hypothetical protein
VRRNPRRFLIIAGHEVPDIESVVDRGDGFFVIEKGDDVADEVE